MSLRTKLQFLFAIRIHRMDLTSMRIANKEEKNEGQFLSIKKLDIFPFTISLNVKSIG